MPAITTNEELRRYQHQAKSLDREQLLALVLADLVHNNRLIDRLDLLAAGRDGGTIAALLNSRLTELMRCADRGDDDIASIIDAFDPLLQQVRDQLLPLDANAAVAIAERLVHDSGALYEFTTECDHEISVLMNATAMLWLACCEQTDLDESEIGRRALALYLADQYGGRNSLLRRANLVLSADALRQLANHCAQECERMAPQACGKELHRNADRRLDLQVAIGLIEEAIADQDTSGSAGR